MSIKCQKKLKLGMQSIGESGITYKVLVKKGEPQVKWENVTIKIRYNDGDEKEMANHKAI